MTTKPRVGATRWSAVLTATAIVAAAVAVARLWWPSLDGSRASDDLLQAAIFATPNEDGTFSANWGQVLADFGRGWIGNDAPLWRPMLSVTFALDLALFGTDPALPHAVNLSMHVVVASLTGCAAAWIARHHGAGHLATACAAALATLFVGLHPIAAEPVCWLAARNSGQEVFFRTIALAIYARIATRTGDDPGLGIRAAMVAAAAAAVATKETGILVLAGAALIEVLRHRRGDPWLAGVVGRLTPLVALVLVYFSLRTWLFGTPFGDPGAGAHSLTAAGTLLGIAQKVRTVVWPFAIPGILEGVSVSLWVFVVALASAIAGLVSCAHNLFRSADWHEIAVAVAFLAILTALAVPSYKIPLAEGLHGSRTVYGFVPLAALGVCRLAFAFGNRGLGGDQRLFLVALSTSAAAFASGSLVRLSDYRAAWDELESASAGIQRIAASDAVAPDRPLALVAMPTNARGVPVLNQNAWFALAQPPQTAARIPVVSLGYISVPVPGAEPLFLDAAGIHAVRELGCTLAMWVPEAGDTVPVPPPTKPAAATSPATLAVDPAAHRFVPEQPLDPFAFRFVQLPDGAPRTGTLLWHAHATDPGIQPVVIGKTPYLDASAPIDLGSSYELAAAGLFGKRLGGLAILDESGNVWAKTTDPARINPAQETSLDWQPLADRPAITVGRAEQSLTAPSAPPDTRMRIVLLGPHSALTNDVVPSAPVVLSDRTLEELRIWTTLAQQRTMIVWFETYIESGEQTQRTGRSRLQLAEIDVGQR